MGHNEGPGMMQRDAAELLALDPSVNSAGVALFRQGQLIAGRCVKRTAGASSDGERWMYMALEIFHWLGTVRAHPTVFVFERPQIYDPTKSLGDPNDLIGLAGVAGFLGGMLTVACVARQGCLEVVSPTPAEWVGNLPKERTGNPWKNPRGSRVESRLTPDERNRLVAVNHDVVDAIGLGLHALGRFERKRVYSGAV